MDYVKSYTNFAFFKTGVHIDEFSKYFKEKGILVGRPFPPYYDWCRISTGKVEDVSKFAGDLFGGISKGVKSVIDRFCDERLKVDIAPLESTEVNDELAQMAFFVKGLRECS